MKILAWDFDAYKNNTSWDWAKFCENIQFIIFSYKTIGVLAIKYSLQIINTNLQVKGNLKHHNLGYDLFDYSYKYQIS